MFTFHPYYGICDFNYSRSKPTAEQILELGTGDYTLTYTATDAAGNVGTATRTVHVYNQAEVFEGTYPNMSRGGKLIFPLPDIEVLSS